MSDGGGVADEAPQDAFTEVSTTISASDAPLDVKMHEISESEPQQESFIMRWLTTLTIVGVAIGVAIGILCDLANANEEWLEVIGFPGDLFIRALKVLVVPMIFCSMVTSTSQMSATGSGVIAKWAVSFYLCTTVLAAITGLVLFNCFQFLFQKQELLPISTETSVTTTVESLSVVQTLLKFGHDMVPENLFEALLNVQLLGVITFAIFFGYMLSKVPGGESVISWFSVCFETMVAMVRAVIIFTPLGVGSLVAKSVASAGDIGAVLNSLGALVLVVLAGQLFHVFVTYAMLYLGFTRKNPYRFLAGLPQVWMTAFGTSSSAATLTTTQAACQKLGVSKQVTHFVLPIGCTVNMDGSALEKPIVILFIAYVSGQPLDFAGQLIALVTSVLLSVGSSPIPSSGLATLLVMLETVGVRQTPEVKRIVGFVLAIEWFLDGVRTMVNVTGDSMGAGIIDHRMKQMDLIDDQEERKVEDVGDGSNVENSIAEDMEV
jgi:solute carrier family 1 (high affinity glutamate transporter) protein 1/solute carrier family 1 (high affinity glutamate transporter) protein 3